MASGTVVANFKMEIALPGGIEHGSYNKTLCWGNIPGTDYGAACYTKYDNGSEFPYEYEYEEWVFGLCWSTDITADWTSLDTSWMYNNPGIAQPRGPGYNVTDKCTVLGGALMLVDGDYNFNDSGRSVAPLNWTLQLTSNNVAVGGSGYSFDWTYT